MVKPNVANAGQKGTKAVAELNDAIDAKISAQDELFEGAKMAPATYPTNLENVLKQSEKVLKAADKAKEAMDKAVDFGDEEMKGAEKADEDRKKDMEGWLADHDRKPKSDWEGEAKDLGKDVAQGLDCKCAKQLYGAAVFLQRPKKCRCAKEDKV